MRLGDLGGRLGIAPSTLTRNLGRLLEQGLVTRVPDPKDARASQVELTAEGRRAAQAVEQQGVGFAEEVLRRMPEGDRAKVVAGFECLLVAVRDATEECCPGAFVHLLEDFTGGTTPNEEG
jgi:DNA-binding MarR family transcriptional regulator